MKNEEYVSIIGTSFLIPLELILFELSNKKHKSNELQTSDNENGLASGAILITVAMLESFLSRLILFGDKEKKPANKYQWFDFKEELSLSDHDLTILDEVYTIRNVVAHNHLWVGTFQYDSEYNMLPGDFEKHEHKNKIYEKVVDKDYRVTKICKLNVFPTLINKIDLIKVFILVTEHLIKIEKAYPQSFRISQTTVKLGEKYMNLQELAKNIWELMGEEPVTIQQQG